MIIALAIFNTPVLAKRVYVEFPDKLVSENIEYRSIYEYSLITQKAYVVATNLKTKKTIWKKRIYTILLNPVLEQDVQWEMITSIEKERNNLVIKNEKEHHGSTKT